jgi:hypothetical protein
MRVGVFRFTNSCGDFSLEGAEGLLLGPYILSIDGQRLVEATRSL